MNKESIIELQYIDCNCSDCKHLLRNNYKKVLSDQQHELWQREEFMKQRNDDLFIAYTMRDEVLLKKTLAKKLTVKKPRLTYGYCKKFDLKEISFIPATCQIETQECFEHRRTT